ILEDGIEHEAVSLNPNELELTASKKTTLSDIARVFNIPESMINAESNKYNSNEQNNIHLLQYTLSPIISSIENALERSLLLEKEKREGYRIRFVTDDILITTEREKFESTIQALKGGIINISEARRRHGYKNIKDNYFMWSIGTVLYNADSRMMTLPNMGVSLDPNNLEQVSELNGNNAFNDKLDNKVKVDSEEEDSEEPDDESEDEETGEKEDSELNGKNAFNDKLDKKVKVDSEEEDSEEPDDESEDEETGEKEDLDEEKIDEDSK